MGEESRSSPRELQLETRHLAFIVLIIVILCVSSFMLGRWVERQAYRVTAEGQIRSGVGESISAEDVNKELTYFRTLEGESAPPTVTPPPPETRQAPVRVESPARPAPSAPGPASAPRRTPPPSAQSAPAPPAEGIMIQVLATKDATAAASLSNRLAARGYRVTIAEGTGPADAGLRKVRVGPFATRVEAERTAKKIETEERVHTWIP